MTNEQISIVAEPRTRTGSRYAKRLRNTGRLPGVIYGQNASPIAISVDEKEVLGHLFTGARVVNIQVEGESETCLIKDLQFGFLGDNVIHMDFTRVNLDQIVTVNVSINASGSPKISADSGAVLEIVRTELEIECKVSDIPTEIKVDLSTMEEVLTVGELELPPGVRATLEPDKHIAHITFIKEEEAEGEEAEVVADGDEPEVITKAKEDEAEGGDASADSENNPAAE